MTSGGEKRSLADILTAAGQGGGSGPKKRRIATTAEAKKAKSGNKRTRAPKNSNVADSSPSDESSASNLVQQQQSQPQQQQQQQKKQKQTGYKSKPTRGEAKAVADDSVVRRGSLRVKRPTATVVSTGDSSLKHMVKQKRDEFASYHRKLADAEARLAKLLAQLAETKRTRRNVRMYNSLVDQREALSQEVTLLRINRPDEEAFYSELQQFLLSNRPDRPPATNSGLKEDASANKNSSSTTTTTAARVDRIGEISNAGSADGDAAHSCTPAVVELRPKHHSLTVTAGAPVFNASQFEFLCLIRADIRQKLEKSVHGNVEQSRVERNRAQFSSIMAKDIRNQLKVDELAAPALFVLSPFGTGVAAPCSKASVEKIRQGLREWNESCVDKQARDQSKIVVTIGKNNADDDDDAQSRKKQSNRLNVKMKDIRNMKNESMLNYVTVTHREKTTDEVQHANFKQFLAQKADEEKAKRRPRYCEDACDECDEELEIDIHSGMVSCPSCGVTYSDGIDSHQWQAIAHVPHSKFEYLKSGHLVTLLKRFQGKEATVIPRDVIDKIAVHLSKKNYDLNTLTFKRMKSVLKTLNLNKFYDHTWQLLHIIADVQPIQFTEEQELAFQAVFDVLEEVYPLYKPPNYENFIFYWYIIGKTAQLLGYPQEIIDMFPLLKNPRKHLQKERIWRNMMNHIGWPYIVTYHDVEARKLLS